MISDSSIFPPEIQGLRAEIEQQLDDYCQFNTDCPAELKQAIRYSLLSPGKRIRPMLVLTANKVCGGNPHDALAAACAVEMIHAYSLIHDDLPAMDDDDMRRGRPSCHVQFDEATAILAGDALIAMAFEIISRDSPPAVAAECTAALAKAAGPTRLVGGQVDDLAAEFATRDIEQLEHIHHRKTGALLRVALQLGAMIANASANELQNLEKYGKHLGLAFQIVDDLLDLRGDQSKIGKRTGKDAEHGKLTYPAVLGEQQSQIRAEEMTDAAITALESFGKNADPLRNIAKFVLERSD